MSAYYTDDHEWVSVDGEIATIGAANHAQDDMLGEIVEAYADAAE